MPTLGKVIALPVRHNEPAAPEPRTDDELVVLARNGVDSAFDELVRRHQQMVLRVAIKHLADPDQATDVAQHTFLEMYPYLPKYEARGKFKALLIRILLNQCRISGRRRQARERMASAFGAAPNATLATVGPEERILEHEEQLRVDRALSRLSEKMRVVVVLRFAGDLSTDDIAQALGLPPGTVRSRLFKALHRLRDELGKGR